MTYEDLCVIEKMWNGGEPVSRICEQLGRTKATIYNAIRSGLSGDVCANGRDKFSASISSRVRYLNRSRLRQPEAAKSAKN